MFLIRRVNSVARFTQFGCCVYAVLCTIVHNRRFFRFSISSCSSILPWTHRILAVALFAHIANIKWNDFFNFCHFISYHILMHWLIHIKYSFSIFFSHLMRAHYDDLVATLNHVHFELITVKYWYSFTFQLSEFRKYNTFSVSLFLFMT